MDWIRGDEDMASYEQSLVENAEILMLGRKTFSDFASHWPRVAYENVDTTAGKTQQTYARRVDSMKKIVVSASGKVAEWQNSEVLPKIEQKAINRLKWSIGGNIVVYGSLSVIDALSRLNRIDEYHLLLHPVALGEGKPVFGKARRVNMELHSVEPFKSGVVLMKYRSGEMD
jgi:dihydrofolate reductase